MKPKTCKREEVLAELDEACRALQIEWAAEVGCSRPNWPLLFDIHYHLVRIERRLKRFRRPA
jgi:hypothetical protein